MIQMILVIYFKLLCSIYIDPSDFPDDLPKLVRVLIGRLPFYILLLLFVNALFLVALYHFRFIGIFRAIYDVISSPHVNSLVKLSLFYLYHFS